MKPKESIQYIYWFAPYNMTCPSTRYRGKFPLDHLYHYYGIKSRFIFPDYRLSSILLFIKAFLSALLFRRKNSLIVVQKICSNRIYANALKLLIYFQNKNTVYDLDDAEHLRQSKETMLFFIKNCENINVGSAALKNFCLQYSSKVSILTSPVKEHKFQKSIRNKVINIGWVGDFGNGNEHSKSFSHKTNMFKVFFPQLLKIDFKIKLTLIGIKNKKDIPEIIKYFKNKPNIVLEIEKDMRWEEDDWLYQRISNFDVGISPMTKHLFNQCKSAFKAKQYLSVGVPVIASDVGDNKVFVTHSKNGFLCKEGKDFLKHILKIQQMKDEEYFKMSTNALKSQEDFSIDNYCKKLIGEQE